MFVFDTDCWAIVKYASCFGPICLYEVNNGIVDDSFGFCFVVLIYLRTSISACVVVYRALSFLIFYEFQAVEILCLGLLVLS